MTLHSPSGNTGAAPSRSRFVAIGALGFMILLGALVFTRSDPVPRDDAHRYITMAQNLAHHGVLSAHQFAADHAPKPTLLQGGPLIGVELAVVSWLDSSSQDLFLCAIKSTAPAESCRGRLHGLKLVHYAELGVALALLWLIGLRLFGTTVAATGVVAVALLVREVLQYTNLALTETLYFMLYMLFAWAFLRLADQGATLANALIAGLALGLTILIKPAAAPLLLVVPVLLIIDAWIAGQRLGHSLRLSGAFAGGVLIVVVPWLVRNWMVAGVFGLADPSYLEASLAHRFAYNAMNWTEWMVGWIYYLPDFGDRLAAHLFPADNYARLGWGDNGFYVIGRDVLHTKVKALNGPDPAIGYLIKTYVFAEPVKYAAVSLLLLWRGIFLSNYLGLFAVLVLPFVIWAMPPSQRRLMAFVGIPALAIAGFNAGISLNIPRYNLALVPVYTIALTWVLIGAFNRIRARLAFPGRGESDGFR